MEMDDKKIETNVKELEALAFFNGINRFPKSFYRDLNQKEQAETVKRYRERNGIGNKPRGLE